MGRATGGWEIHSTQEPSKAACRRCKVNDTTQQPDPAVVGALLAVTTRMITAQLVGKYPGIRGALRLRLTGPGWLPQAGVLAAILVAAIVLLSLPGMYLSGLDGPLPQLVVVANLLVIVVAGLYVGVRLAMSVPAAVIEGRRR